MLERKTTFDHVTIMYDGSVQVRVALLIVEGDQIVSRSWHRTSIDLNNDTANHLEVVNSQLESIGFPPLPCNIIALIERVSIIANESLK